MLPEGEQWEDYDTVAGTLFQSAPSVLPEGELETVNPPDTSSRFQSAPSVLPEGEPGRFRRW